MTRRAILKAIFEIAVERGLTVQDLLDRINRFSAEGGSGLESFVREYHAELTTPAVNPEVEAAKARVEEAQAALAQAQANLAAVA